MPIPYEVRDRYLKEAHTNTVDVKLEEKQIDYVLDELEGYDKLRDDAAGTEVRANLRKTTANLILITPLCSGVMLRWYIDVHSFYFQEDTQRSLVRNASAIILWFGEVNRKRDFLLISR